MNTFTFGRVDNMKVDVNGWQMDGDQVRVSGYTEYGEYGEAITIRNQLLGYGPGRDEDVVPIVWDDRPENNGYYQVLSISASEEPSRAPFGVIDWSMSLYRIQGYAAPLIEATVVGGTRTNTREMQSLWFIGVPGSVRQFVEYSPVSNAFFTRSPEVRQCEGGTVAVFEGGQRIKQWYVDPDAFYEGAATIKSDDQIVVGRRMSNNVEGWELSNGLFKVRLADGATGFRLSINTWQPGSASWSADWQVDLQGAAGLGSPADLSVPHTITILRNSPEEVIVRFATTVAANKDPLSIDMSLKRGSYFASLYWKSTYSNSMGVQPVAGMSGWLGHLGGWFKGWYPGVGSARINAAKNPSVQFNATGWAAMAGTGQRMPSGATTAPQTYDIAVFRATTTASHSASAFGIRYGASNSDDIPVVAGTTYYVSMYGLCEVGKTMSISVKFYNSGGAQVGSTMTGSSQVMTANTWYRFTCAAGAAPVGAVRAVVEFVGNTSWVSGEHVEADALLFEPVGALANYFDGNQAWTTGTYYAWEGETANSRSVAYAPVGTDGGQFITGPQEISAQPNQFVPYEADDMFVEEWKVAIGQVPNDRSVDLWDEIRRYFWATTDRVSVVAQ